MQQCSRLSQMAHSTIRGPESSAASSRTRSRRNEKRGDHSNAAPTGQQSHGSQFGPFGRSYRSGGMPLELVAPLELSANRWTPASISRKPQAVDPDSPEIVERKVKGFLNKLTAEEFDFVLDQSTA
jgi:translation initiation factor 4G